MALEEMQEFGCPHCGYRSGTTPVSAKGTALWQCGECNKTCCALAPGVTRSDIGFGERDKFYPELQDHPRRGTPSHGQSDKRPEGGGEFFGVRGIGLDETPGCFACGGKNGMRSNIAAFVQCKEAGERVVRMFRRGARLDYRDFEPDRVQVKIGACDKHLPKLQKLSELTQEGVITKDHIATALA